MQKKTFTTTVGGKALTAEFNDLADQADGSTLIRYGNTVVLATVVMSTEPKNVPFFPLVVDYEEKFYAAGQILGSRFMRREGRPSDEAVLSARLIDRTIRPLFDHAIRNEVQVVITVLSIDEDDPDILSLLATSLALGTSSIPWNGPVSAVRIGKKRGEGGYVINPEYSFRNHPDTELDAVVCGKDDEVSMIEMGGSEVDEETVYESFKKALEELKKIQSFQEQIIKEIGAPKRKAHIPPTPRTVKEVFDTHIQPTLYDSVFTRTPGKEKVGDAKKKWEKIVQETFPEEEWSQAVEYLEERVNDLIHTEAVERSVRPDGRALDEVRPLYAQAGDISPIAHGSGIFYRGGTHVLSVLTLGGPSDALFIDGMESQETHKRFMHHYNFPPFSVGDTGRIGGFNRRMIGHGALAEKALQAVIPSKEDFPYTIRIVSEALASNGSTSMGSVCGSTLALMDAGVPIKAPVAGVAMGLMMGESKKKHAVLTDIQGPEDHYGDMDLKVAGTRSGVTAIQMDVKLDSVPLSILREALDGARRARHTILDTITQEIPKPRPDLPKNAPRILSVSIQPDQIGLVIGPGGKTINEIKDATGADIDIEDDGTVYITGIGDQTEKARTAIEEITREYTKGDEFMGEVVKITDFGAFVKIGPKTDGLVHVSEIAPFRVEKVDDVLAVGQSVPVVVKDIDEKGRLKLSIKERDPEFIKKQHG